MEHTVLVVEDEKGIRESLKLFLKSHNYEVVEAENGAEALKKICDLTVSEKSSILAAFWE